MLREQIRDDIAKEVDRMVGKWDGRVEVMRTSDAKFGDYTTNVALRLTPFAQGKPLEETKVFKISGSYQSSLEFARVLADRLKDQPYVEKLEVAGPGFINFFIKSEVWQKEVEEVLKKGSKFGSNTTGKGKKARVEFVSANPTGPLHFGNARGGPIGDALASVLEFYGYKVIREYYHNDVGGQVRKLGEAIINVSKGQRLEDQEYKGEYVQDLASNISKPGLKVNAKTIGDKAVDILLEEILKDCGAMGIKFDEIFPESKFIESGKTEEAIKKLDKKGLIKDQEGATWFAPNDEFFKDRETVVKKSDGSYTYFANDIAYHDLKFKDGPDLVIDVFGANHHGHVPRLQAVIGALDHDVSKFHVILYQWVRFKRGGELMAMSKRSGTFVTAREVLDEVGKDALRFFILMYDPNSDIDFDLALAIKKSKNNPVYYVQYAHARICSILSKSVHEPGLKIPSKPGSGKANWQLLTTNYELELIKQIARLPELVSDIGASFAVHRLTGYATDLADSFHRFYENCRVIGEKEDLMRARIGLVMATKTALANTLKLLGITAPEKM